MKQEDIEKYLEGLMKKFENYNYRHYDDVEIAWRNVLLRFHQPLLHHKPAVYPMLPAPDSAHFDFSTLKTNISERFLEELVEEGGIDRQTAIEGILQHEVGHYVIHPRELADLLFQGHLAESYFGKKWQAIYAYYTDACDNIPQILSREKSRPIKELYKAMNRLAVKGKGLPPQVAQNPEELRKATAVDRLLAAFYQKQAGEDMGIVLEPELEGKLQELMAIEFDTSGYEAAKIMHFGNIIKDLIYTLPNQGGNGDGEPGEGGSGPMLGGISIDDFSNGQIEEALDKIIQKYGKERYGKIRDFAEKVTGKTFDRKRGKSEGKMAGIGKTNGLERNDDMIPFYARLSRGSGTYIIKKPVIVDTKDHYPAENVEFSPSDPLNRLNKFSTGGRILPGVTKRFKEGTGRKRDRLYRVPDCLIGIDTSGSMKHTREKSPAVGCGFTLARNYHANGAKIGVLNFSTESFMVFPTRELDDVYKALCAYWGGGTILDTEKLRHYFEQYRLMEMGKMRVKDLELSTEEDYKRLIERLSPSERKMFEQKAGISIKLKETKEAYEKLDTHIITDGEIYNMPEVIGYFNSIAGIARNVVYVVNNPKQAKAWEKLHLPNTQVLDVGDISDLQGFVIGRIKKINPARQGLEWTL
ncbi:MAG TPA: hypothetical protein HA362_03855 [Nanoarchaeota archaeon]|nr:hypothetical protein [Nanoarchaeota archaeon]